MKPFIYIIFICMILSCSESRERRMALQRAVSVMNDAPDSALHILDSLKEHKQQFGRHFRMQCRLHRTNALNKLDTLFRTTDDTQQLADYFDGHGTPNEKMLAHYLLGRAYYDTGESPMALKCFQDAVAMADTTDADCDYWQLSRVYGQMGYLFYEKRVPQYCLNAIRIAEQTAWKAKDTLNAIHFYSRQTSAYELWNITDSMLCICHKSRDLYEKYGYNKEKAYVLPTIIKCCLDKGQYEEAYRYFKEFERESGLFHNGEIVEGLEYNYYFKGMCFYGLNQLDSAEIYFRKMLKHSADIEMSEAAYRGMMYLYERRSMPDSLVKYSKLFCDANDTASVQQSSSEILRTQALYDYMHYKHEAKVAKQKSEKYHKTIIYVYISVSVLVFFIIGFILRNKKKREQAIKQQNEKYTALYTELDKAKEDYELLQTDTNAYRKNQEEKIRRLHNALSMYQESPSPMENWTIEHFLIESPIVKQLRKKVSEHVKMTTPEHTCLMNLMHKHNSEFMTEIDDRKNMLTDNEKTVSVLIKLDFSPSDITILLNMTKQNISNIRSSINFKIFKSKGTKGLDSNLKKI